MKIFTIILFLIGSSFVEASGLTDQVDHFQNLFGNPSSNTKITTTEYNQGETRPKAVLKGVFYFGGTDRKRKLLSSGYKEMLCEDGFSHVYSVYDKVNEKISCSGNSLPYSYIGEAKSKQKSGDKVYTLMKQIYGIINNNGNTGAIYLHCYYGVHASNTIAQMVLKQFCGISDSQAISNWDTVDLYNSLGSAGTKKQEAKIRAFNPYPEFQISKAQQSVVCY